MPQQTSILLIANQDANREILKIFEGPHYRIYLASSSASALSTVSCEEIDVIIASTSLETDDPINILRALREAHCEEPVFIYKGDVLANDPFVTCDDHEIAVWPSEMPPDKIRLAVACEMT